MEAFHSPAVLLSLLLVIVSIWKLICIGLRRRRAKYLASLSPVKDARKLLWFAYAVEFPFLSQKALEFVGIHSFKIPSISKLLYQTKHFVNETPKRADDTDLLIKEMLSHHVDSDRGSYALRRINAMHSQYRINNQDFIFVLCLYTLLPIDFAARFGYRSWTEAEQLASYIVWHDVGIRMGFTDIPKSIQEMRDFVQDFEREKTAFDERNCILVDKLKPLAFHTLPRWLRPFASWAILSVYDDSLRMGTRSSKLPAVAEFTILKMLKLFLGTWVSLFLPPRSVSMACNRFEVDWSPNAESNPDKLTPLKINLYTPSFYKNGYKLSELGSLKSGKLGQAAQGLLLCPFSTN